MVLLALGSAESLLALTSAESLLELGSAESPPLLSGSASLSWLSESLWPIIVGEKVWPLWSPWSCIAGEGVVSICKMRELTTKASTPAVLLLFYEERSPRWEGKCGGGWRYIVIYTQRRPMRWLKGWWKNKITVKMCYNRTLYCSVISVPLTISNSFIRTVVPSTGRESVWFRRVLTHSVVIRWSCRQ